MAKSYRYSYVARDESGNTRTGSLMAEDEPAAARRLRALGMLPLSLMGGPGAKNSKTLLPKRVKPKHLAVFSRQLATMVLAGLPLTRALKALSDQSDHPEIKKATALVAAEVEGGTAMSSAMEVYPKVFPPLMTTMIRAGEASGSLGNALEQIASMYEKQAALRSKIFSAMFYPVIVLGFAFLLVAGMLIFIVPIFESVFSQLGAELPLPTRILVGVSSILKVTFPIMIVGVIALYLWYRKQGDSAKIKSIIDPWKIKIPILGKFNKDIVLARWARTISSLLETGVPLLEALEISANTAGNHVYYAAVMRIREGVRSGQPLSLPMKNEDVFPGMVYQMVSTGEESGSLPVLLEKVADFYDGEVETRAETLTSVIEPLMLVFLGVIIGAMVIALYLPMFSVYENV